MWLQEHIEEFEPGAGIENTTHTCDICAPYLDAARPRKELASFLTTEDVRGKGYSRIVGNFGAKPSDFDPMNPVSMCGLWITPSYMADCDIWPEEASEEAIRVSIAYASEILNKLIGSQIRGVCELTVHPGAVNEDDDRWRNKEIYCPPGKIYSDKISDNARCPDPWFDECSGDELRLPGPIQAIGEIVINGEILSKDSYFIKNSNILVRCDGKPWHRDNNCMKRSPYKVWPERIVEADSKINSGDLNWKDRYLVDENIHPAKEIFKMPEIDGVECAPDWAADFLASNPLVFKDHSGKHWVDSFLSHNGIEPVKVCKDKIFGNQWILSPSQIDSLTDKPKEVGCKSCYKSMSFGECCNKCGMVDAIVYNPEASQTGKLPTWIEQWADRKRIDVDVEDPKHWLEIAADECGLYIEPHEIENFPVNTIELCTDDTCKKEPEEFSLHELNYNPLGHDVVGITLTACCHSQGNVLLKELGPIVSGCGYESFKMVIHHASSSFKDDDCEETDVNVACLDNAPSWAKSWLNDDYVEEDCNYEELDISNSDRLPEWLAGGLGPSAPSEVEEFFKDWVKNNSKMEIETPAKKTIAAEPPSIHVWNDSETYNAQNALDDGTVSWAIRYYAGEVPSESAKLAAAFLAKEIVTSLCGSNTCFNSRHLSRLTIDQSADFRWPDIFKSLEKGLTGIMEIDLFIKSCNPNGLQRTGYGFSACKYAKSRKVHTLRRPY